MSTVRTEREIQAPRLQFEMPPQIHQSARFGDAEMLLERHETHQEGLETAIYELLQDGDELLRPVRVHASKRRSCMPPVKSRRDATTNRTTFRHTTASIEDTREDLKGKHNHSLSL